MSLAKQAGECTEEYIWRLGSDKDAGLISLSWDELADVINSNLWSDEIDYLGSSAYRKQYSNARNYYNNVFSKKFSSIDSDEKLRQLEELKVKYRDERAAWSRQNRLAARLDSKLEQLEAEFKNISLKQFPGVEVAADVKGSNDLLVILSDFHIGSEFSNQWGVYNVEKAEQRLEQLLINIVEIQKRHGSQKCYISMAGDLISGNIHKSIQVENSENVISQIKIASELISSFCYKLCSYFNEVIMTDVSGNHSRIDKKEDAIHDERLDNIIAWAVNLSLQNVENFTYIKSPETSISKMYIRGKLYVGVHGDYDSFDVNGVSRLCMTLGEIPYAITFGHKHTPAFDECNGVKMIRGGSLSGSGDSYTIEKRLTGSPCQVVCVCNGNGVECFYPIDLK